VTPEACGEHNGGLRVSQLADNTSLSIDGQLFQQATDYANLQAGTYPVTVKDANNCLVTKLVLVPSDCPSQLHLPTAFSPNADQSNDALTVYFRFPSISVARFTVFDRWGAVIHNRTNFVLSNGDSLWDGQLNGNTAPAGTYLYQLDCQFPNGVQTILHQSVSLLH
jgi:gliding motility-associated-like protein